MSSGGMLVGIVAAVALPNFMTAMDRGKQKRTVADLEGAGTVLAAYALDHEDGYPVSEDWRPLGEVLPELPAKDGWGHALEYWSDGERYVIVSRGKDGETERDWRRSEGLGGARPAFEADIVLADGVLVAWPGEPE
jgi:type II secretory pathway pseudopilin PulG